MEVASATVSTSSSGAGVGQSSCLVMILGRLLLAGEAKVCEGMRSQLWFLSGGFVKLPQAMEPSHI